MARPPASLEDIRRRAGRRLPGFVTDFVEGGADGEATLRRNEEALAALTLVPRALRDVSEATTGTTVLGDELELPVLIAPTGMSGLVHPGGDVAGAEAAARAGTVFCLSTMSSEPIEAVARVEGARIWFQVALWRDRELAASLIDRARSAGVETLIVTVDVPAVGNRLRDRRNGLTVPPRIGPRTALEALKHPRWLLGRPDRLRFANVSSESAVRSSRGLQHAKLIDRILANPAATWDDVEWIRERWPGTLLIKGILHPDDAREAVGLGADGLIVSNHGGRQLDGAQATIDALPAVVAASGAAEVLVDGGFRRGTDVVKAVALGARGCLIGRPWLHGLAAGGAGGVEAVLDLLKEELLRSLKLLGVNSVDGIGPHVLERGS